MSKGVRRKGDRGGKGYERRENRKREGQKQRPTQRSKGEDGGEIVSEKAPEVL